MNHVEPQPRKKYDFGSEDPTPCRQRACVFTPALASTSASVCALAMSAFNTCRVKTIPGRGRDHGTSPWQFQSKEASQCGPQLFILLEFLIASWFYPAATNPTWQGNQGPSRPQFFPWLHPQQWISQPWCSRTTGHTLRDQMVVMSVMSQNDATYAIKMAQFRHVVSRRWRCVANCWGQNTMAAKCCWNNPLRS